MAYLPASLLRMTMLAAAALLAAQAERPLGVGIMSPLRAGSAAVDGSRREGCSIELRRALGGAIFPMI